MPVVVNRRQTTFSGSQAEHRIGEALREGWKPLGDALVHWLTTNSPKYTGRYKKSHKRKTRGVGLHTELVVYSSDQLGTYKDRGRGPGKRPPPDKILAWVKFKGLTMSGSRAPIEKQQRTIAFLIGRKMGKVGNIGPKKPNLYTKVIPANKGIIAREIRSLSDAVAFSLNNP